MQLMFWLWPNLGGDGWDVRELRAELRVELRVGGARSQLLLEEHHRAAEGVHDRARRRPRAPRHHVRRRRTDRKLLDHLERAGVEDLRRLVAARRQDLRVVRAPRRRIDRALRDDLLDHEGAVLAVEDRHLLVGRRREEARAVGREADAVDELGVLLRRLVELERRPLVEVDLAVLAGGGDAERARRLERDGVDALRVAADVADGVARVPHEDLRHRVLALARRHHALRVGRPRDVEDRPAEHRRLELEDLLGVVARPDPHDARRVARRDVAAARRHLDARHLVPVLRVQLHLDRLVASRLDVADDDDLIAAIEQLRAIRRQLERRWLSALRQGEGRVDVVEAHRE